MRASKLCLFPLVLTAMSPLAHSADIRFNGFGSIVGGMTVSEGTTRDHLTEECRVEIHLHCRPCNRRGLR